MREKRKSNEVRRDPEYGVYSRSSGEPLHAIELHVLARAYRAAWRSLFTEGPLGPHAIDGLDVLFVFSAEAVEGDG